VASTPKTGGIRAQGLVSGDGAGDEPPAGSRRIDDLRINNLAVFVVGFNVAGGHFTTTPRSRVTAMIPAITCLHPLPCELMK